jgi:hypothetical protein
MLGAQQLARLAQQHFRALNSFLQGIAGHRAAAAASVEIFGQRRLHRLGQHRHMGIIRMIEADGDRRAGVLKRAMSLGANEYLRNWTDDALPSRPVFSRVGSGSLRSLAPASSMNAWFPMPPSSIKMVARRTESPGDNPTFAGGPPEDIRIPFETVA